MSSFRQSGPLSFAQSHPHNPNTGAGVPGDLIAANNIVALLGDSRVARVDGGAGGGFMSANGFALWARRFTQCASDFSRAYNFAVGGYTTADVIANKLAACCASDAGTVMVLVSLNDMTASSPDLPTSIANLATIIDTIRAAGKIVVIGDEYPISSPTPIYHAGLRDYIRSRHSPADGVYVAASWNSIASAPDANTPAPDMFPAGDSAHVNSNGASFVGAAFADALLAALPAFDLFARPGVTVGGDFTGTAGAKLNGVTGSVPTGWSVNLIAGTATSVNVSQEIIGGVNWMHIDLVGGVASQILVYTPNILTASGLVAGTDYIDSVIRSKLVGTSGINRMYLRAFKQSGTAIMMPNGNPANDGGAEATDLLPADSDSMALCMPRVLLPADATQLVQRIEIQAKTGVACAGRFSFATPQIRRANSFLEA